VWKINRKKQLSIGLNSKKFRDCNLTLYRECKGKILNLSGALTLYYKCRILHKNKKCPKKVTLVKKNGEYTVKDTTEKQTLNNCQKKQKKKTS